MGIEASRVPCPKELLRPKHVMYTVQNSFLFWLGLTTVVLIKAPPLILTLLEY